MHEPALLKGVLVGKRLIVFTLFLPFNTMSKPASSLRVFIWLIHHYVALRMLTLECHCITHISIGDASKLTVSHYNRFSRQLKMGEVTATLQKS